MTAVGDGQPCQPGWVPPTEGYGKRAPTGSGSTLVNIPVGPPSRRPWGGRGWPPHPSVSPHIDGQLTCFDPNTGQPVIHVWPFPLTDNPLIHEVSGRAESPVPVCRSRQMPTTRSRRNSRPDHLCTIPMGPPPAIEGGRGYRPPSLRPPPTSRVDLQILGGRSPVTQLTYNRKAPPVHRVAVVGPRHKGSLVRPRREGTYFLGCSCLLGSGGGVCWRASASSFITL